MSIPRINNPRDLYKFARKHGFAEVPGRGKGSHLIMKNVDGVMISVPDPKRDSKCRISGKVVRQVTRLVLNGTYVVAS